MESYDLIVVTPAIHARAAAEVEHGDPPPDPIAVTIVTALNTLAGMMHDEEMTCAVCADADAYEFALKEPPIEMLCCIPAGGSTAPPIAAPVCATCADQAVDGPSVSWPARAETKLRAASRARRGNPASCFSFNEREYHPPHWVPNLCQPGGISSLSLRDSRHTGPV